MNIEDIKKLAKIVSQYSLSGLEIQEGDMRIRLEGPAISSSPAPLSPAVPAPTSPLLPQEQAMGPLPVVLAPELDFNNLHETKSPMVGVFYGAPAPDAKPFVTVGDKVKKGDVLCIIEAMKLMNEITCDISGEIIDICAYNGDVVEYGQVLFKIFPEELG